MVLTAMSPEVCMYPEIHMASDKREIIMSHATRQLDKYFDEFFHTVDSSLQNNSVVPTPAVSDTS